MNIRPTPETDKMASMMRTVTEWRTLCENLERQRDEACENLRATQKAWVRAKAERAEAIRERDEARSLFESSKRARQSLSDACDSLQQELRGVREQRDCFAEALRRIGWVNGHGVPKHTPEAHIARATFASVKGDNQ